MNPAPPDSLYPAMLVNFVGEPFFMSYGSSYLGELLNPRQLRRVERYCDSRDRLVAALRIKLAALAQSTSEMQARTLSEFASAQANALRKLEADAESLRDEFSYLDDGSALIKRRNVRDPETASRRQVHYAALLAAQFHPGLLIEQRQLLHAIAQETADGSSSDSSILHIFFLPATARIRWPQATNPGLPERLLRFKKLQHELASELNRSVASLPENTSRGQLRKHYAALGKQQAPQFDELHRLAEEIRINLAEAAYPDQPVPSGLPEELVRRVGEVAVRQRVLQTTTDRLFQKISRAFAPEKLKLSFLNGSPVIEMASGAEPVANSKISRARMLDRLRKPNEELQREYRALARDIETARTEVQRYRATLGTDHLPEVDILSAQLAQTYIREENWRRFADYRAAVLLPGLSPAQRRLLFNAALRDLEKHRLQAMD